MRRGQIFHLDAKFHIVAAHDESATPKYLSFSSGGEKSASFIISQRFEQTMQGRRKPQRTWCAGDRQYRCSGEKAPNAFAKTFLCNQIAWPLIITGGKE